MLWRSCDNSTSRFHGDLTCGREELLSDVEAADAAVDDADVAEDLRRLGVRRDSREVRQQRLDTANRRQLNVRGSSTNYPGHLNSLVTV